MRRPPPVLLLIALALAVLARPAAAATGPCLDDGTGPPCHRWMARVVSINDGDTIDVEVEGDHSARVLTVRFTGVQAMELTRYSAIPARRRGQCHAVEATRRVVQLLRASHGRVRLSAQDPGKRFGRRLGRFVAVRSGGRWRDLGAMLMAEGHTLWMPDETEKAWNARYALLGRRASDRHAGIWNPTHCGAGPAQSVPLRLWVNWDPPGIDASDLDGEWVRLRNLSATEPLALGGWWIRDSGLRRHTFGAGTVLAPGATLTLHDGPGADTAGDLHWGLSEAVFQNIGDGAYLFDPDGDLRASMVYPCAGACGDPLQGAVSVSAHPRTPEYADVRNVSGRPVDLYGYALRLSGLYAFGPGSVLAPGQSVRVHVGGDPARDTAAERHWGVAGPVLRDAGGRVAVSTFDGIVLACDAWGDGRC
jgi:endonuclease YncB( thermonuclease family)